MADLALPAFLRIPNEVLIMIVEQSVLDLRKEHAAASPHRVPPSQVLLVSARIASLASLKTLRLVHPRFADLDWILRELFSTVQFLPSLEDQDQDTSALGRIAHFVRHVSFKPATNYPLPADDVLEDKRREKSAAAWQKPAWECRLHILQIQRRFDDGTLLQHFSEALGRLPLVDRLVVARQPRWSEHSKFERATHIDYEFLLNFREAYAPHWAQDEEREISIRNGKCKAWADPMQLCASRGRDMRRLCLQSRATRPHSSGHQLYFEQANGELLLEEIRDLPAGAFHGVSSLHYRNPKHYFSYTNYNAEQIAGGIMALISKSATTLESLSLEASAATLQTSTQPPALPHLKALDIRDCYIDPEFLGPWIAQSPDLQRIELHRTRRIDHRDDIVEDQRSGGPQPCWAHWEPFFRTVKDHPSRIQLQFDGVEMIKWPADQLHFSFHMAEMNRELDRNDSKNRPHEVCEKLKAYLSGASEWTMG